MHSRHAIGAYISRCRLIELFKARLTAEDLVRLEHDSRVKPHIGLSPERQLEVYKDEILEEWFGQREGVSAGG